jgi:transcriptional regulator with XRE-family HTH domain
MSDFSVELTRLMRDQGVGVRSLARRSGYSAAHISQLARARRYPSPEAAADLDDALAAGGALAATLTGAVRGTAGDSGSAAVEEATDVLIRIQKLARARVDPEVITRLGDDLRDAVAGYESLDHGHLTPLLTRQRACAEALLADCGHPEQRRQLFAIAGIASGVLGYICTGRGDFPLARAYSLESFRLMEFAQDTGFQAWSRGMQSFCEYYAGRYDDALNLARDGLRYAAGGPQSVRLLANGAARALGKLGDAEGVHRTVADAWGLMSRNEPPNGIPSSITLGCYSQDQIAANAATAYVSLGMPRQVREHIQLAMPRRRRSRVPVGQVPGDDRPSLLPHPVHGRRP